VPLLPRLLLRKLLSQRRPRRRKLKKALADANQNQTVAISVALFFFCLFLIGLFADICSLSLVFSFCGAAEKIGVSWKLR
jgi:hypothetical protein